MGTRFSKGLFWLITFFGTLIVPAEQLPVKTYTIADGLARDYVLSIHQDSHGYIWFCTAEGISRFDGYSFTNYGMAEGLPHREVNDFVETADGDYLFGTDNGLVQFDPEGRDTSGSFFTPVLKLEFELTIFALLDDPDGTVWAGTSDGLYHLTKTNGRWEPEFVDVGINDLSSFGGVESMVIDNEGALWLGTGTGLFRRFADGRTEFYDKNNGMPVSGISALLQDMSGRIWASTAYGLVLLVEHPKPGGNIVKRIYTVKDGLGHNFMDSLYQSSDGRIWVGTRGGLNVLLDAENTTGAAFRRFAASNGIPNIRLTCISEDSDHNLWIGAENSGVRKLPLSGFTSFFESDELGTGRINQIFADNENNVHVLCSDPGSFIPISARYDGSDMVREPLELPINTQLSWGWNQLITQGREWRCVAGCQFGPISLVRTPPAW